MNKDLQTLAKTEATRALVIGNSVYDALLFDRRIVHFSARQFRFLNAYRLEVPMAEAALKAGLTIKQAEYFLKRESTKSWLADRARMTYIKNEWNGSDKWWDEGHKVMEGKAWTKAQLEVWKEFGDRIVPKQSRNSESHTKIEINIDPAALKEARIREEAIEARLAKEEAA